MRAAMMVLALACLLIGLWPQAIVLHIFDGLRHLGPLANVSPEMLGAIPNHLAMASRLLLGLVLAVFLLQRLLYRGKPIEQSGTWGCGFTQPTARIQYTGTSYALSLVEFFRPFVTVKTGYPGMVKIFPDPTAFSSKVADVAETALDRLLIQPLFYVLSKLRWIQHGYIQLYIGYIILTIAALLLVS